MPPLPTTRNHLMILLQLPPTLIGQAWIKASATQKHVLENVIVRQPSYF
jgi:hypothetical protein